MERLQKFINLSLLVRLVEQVASDFKDDFRNFTKLLALKFMVEFDFFFYYLKAYTKVCYLFALYLFVRSY